MLDGIDAQSIDADMAAVANIDDLFDLPAPAAVYIRRWAQRARLPIAARTLRAAAL